jgi:hypothetical protein
MMFRVIYWLFWAKFKIAFLPYRFIRKDLGIPILNFTGENENPQLHSSYSDAVRKTQIWIARAQRVLPFKCQCLVLAIAARKSLARLGVPCVLYLGVSKGNLKLLAHAWVCVGDLPVVGVYENGPHYTVVQKFC